MKLLVCFKCKDIFSLTHELRECSCKLVSGQYRPDGWHADVYMPDRKSGAVLGFANSSFEQALRNQINYGDKTEEMIYAGGKVAPGREFNAFIVPESAPTVEYHYYE